MEVKYYVCKHCGNTSPQARNRLQISAYAREKNSRMSTLTVTFTACGNARKPKFSPGG